MAYRIKEFLQGRMIAEYRAEALHPIEPPKRQPIDP